MSRAMWLVNQIQQYRYKKGAELGVLRGPTFKYVVNNTSNLEHIGVDVFCPDNVWKGKIISTTKELLEIPALKWYQELLDFCEENKPARIIRDFTQNACHDIEDNSLDYIFIDASHDHDSVKRDITLWTPKVRKGGMVSGHDINELPVAMAVAATTPKHDVGPDNVWWYIK